MQERVTKKEDQEMSNDFDKAMDELQASIIKDARKIYSEKVIERWLNPTYMGEIENPQGYGKVTGVCGDTVQIYLKVDNDKITDARFITDGCATTIAAGGMACELAMGKTFKEAFKITKDTILEQLDGLPEESIHCALLASDTLRASLTDYIQSKNQPWRKLYKKY